MEKDEANLAFFNLKYENQNTDVGYERDQCFSGLKPQGQVVGTPVSINPGLNFNPGFFFFLSKALSWIIFYISFRASIIKL